MDCIQVADQPNGLLNIIRHRVLQEAVRLSTTMSVWRSGELEPRPFILRISLTRDRDSFAVMPAGFVRIGDLDDVYAMSLQRGVLTADASIPSKTLFAETSFCRAPSALRSSALVALGQAGGSPITCSGSAALGNARRGCVTCALCSTLLELCDSRIGYRQRDVMVAARGPVIDPYRTRSCQLPLGGVPVRADRKPSRRDAPHAARRPVLAAAQISTARVARLRTAQAVRVDDRLIFSVENALMHLSAAISSTFL